MFTMTMCAFRESWFYEGGFEDDCKSLNAPLEAGRPEGGGEPAAARRECSWSRGEELLTPEMEKKPEDGARFIACTIGIAISMTAFLVILYGVVIHEASPYPKGWEMGVPVDENVLRQLPAQPGDLPKFIEEVSKGNTRSPFLVST